MNRAEIPYTWEEVATLVASIERLRPFADVLDALRELLTSLSAAERAQVLGGTAAEFYGL